MRQLEEKIFKVLMIAASAIIMGALLFILYTIVRRGRPSLSWDMVTKLPGGGFYLGKEGGILNAILGSFYLIIGAVVLSLLFSIPVVMFINFYLSPKSVLSNVVRFSFDILFGIPSIVYGAFGFTLMIWLGIKASLLGGIVAVAMMIAPIMMRAIDEVARLIPKDLQEAPLSLGATKYEMIKVMLRQLLPGIATAILLSVGR
ncbi:MAG: ABC transporter permease subunit, partial [Bacteroidota bacterium]|nr:ABC transporter permease subunit [Bacteroidota bacterium]